MRFKNFTMKMVKDEFILWKISEEIIFVPKNIALATKYEFRPE